MIRRLWLLFVALLPVQFATSAGIRFAPSDLVAAALSMLLLVTGGWRVPRRMVSAWMVALLLLFAAGTVRAAMVDGAPTQYVLVQKDLGLLVLVVQFLLVGVMVRGGVQFTQTLRVFVGSIAVLNLVALLEFATSRLGLLDVRWMNYGADRVSGLLVDPNAYGGLLLTALPFLVAPSSGERNLFATGVTTTLRVTLVTGIVLTFSRTAWVATVLMIVYAALRRPAIGARMLVAGAGAGLALYLAVGPSVSRLLVQMGSRPATVASRVETSAIAWERFLAHPLLGTGLGWFERTQDFIVHSTGLWLLAELGLIGLAVFLGFAVWMLRRAVRLVETAPPAERGLYLALALAFIAMFGLSQGIEALYQRHWWLVMGIIAAGPHADADPSGVTR
ncbi:MAG TPA: O-antigen ligase family protein [Gemmatimonadales bacterium]|nr:O-antigen ligase family protein [Gemmatimonadales bacterium]